jgi:hypothetical protein
LFVDAGACENDEEKQKETDAALNNLYKRWVGAGDTHPKPLYTCSLR